MAFLAKYRGECADCGQSIEVGNEVFYAGDLVHVTCPIDRVVICDRCFLTKPCGCDDI